MYKLEYYNAYEQIKELKPQWDQIYNSNKELSPFQTFTWNKCLIENKIFKGKLNFALLYKNEKLLIIAPFIKKNKILYNEITFLGMKTHADYLNFIYENDLEYEDFEYFITKIFSDNKKTVLFLRQINEKSRIAEFADKLKLNKIKNESVCVKIPIYISKEEYYNSLGKRTRRQARYYDQNRLENSFKSVEFKFLKETRFQEEFIDKLIKVYINRRLVKLNKVGFTEQYINFLKQYIKESEDIFLSICYIDGNIAAYNLGAESKDCTICILINAIDSNYIKNSVGNALLYKTINYLIGENINCTYYDLTRGEELYKYKYGGIKHSNYHFILAVNKKLLIIYKLNCKIKSILIKLIKGVKNDKT